MYTQYYGLKQKPFELAPDPKMLYLSKAHKEALLMLRSGARSTKEFFLLTGGVGTGKTTLLNVLVRSFTKSLYYCMLSNPTLDRKDFYYFIASRFNFPFRGDREDFMVQCTHFFKTCRQQRKKVLIIIDEAHALPISVIEATLQLVKLAAESRAILTVFLVGQPEMNVRLEENRLRSLKRRIAIRHELPPFPEEDTAHYIYSRLNLAGGKTSDLFTPRAISLIHAATKGNPRLINILCDRALLSGFSEEQLRIDDRMVYECIEELHLPGEEEVFFLPPRRQSKRKKVALCVLLAVCLVAGLTAGAYFAWEWIVEYYHYLVYTVKQVGHAVTALVKGWL